MSQESQDQIKTTMLGGWVSVVFKPAHLRRTGATALLVGTWLTAVNHLDVMLNAEWEWSLAAKVLLNYLTPFVVANVGLLSRQVPEVKRDVDRAS